jgi:glyoxylase-like metal-dependent hydrolase (beta-lactamase superfamily II)
MKTRGFFDPGTSTITHVAYDEVERRGVVIDPVLDYDPASGRTSTRSADAVARFLDEERIRVPYVLDTHAHADHLTALPYFKQRYGAKTVIGAGITRAQQVFRELFNLGDSLPTDGRQFDVLVDDGETLDVGPFALEALHTPGHTEACMSYRVEDALFVGDALFQPDYGTARCDFPGGSAAVLYDSIMRLYDTLPEGTRVYTCHDYQPGGRDVAFESTLREQRESNVQLSATTGQREFIAFRNERDATLAVPELMLPAVQVNVRGGAFPSAEENGVAYLKIPIDTFGNADDADDAEEKA